MRISLSSVSTDPVKQNISGYFTSKLDKLRQSTTNEGVPASIAHELMTESAFTALRKDI